MRIKLVRKAIAAAAKTADRKLTCTAFTPDSPTEPHFFVAEYTIDYNKTYGGSPTVEFTTRVLVGRQDDRAAQELTDDYLSDEGDKSLKLAIEAARGAPGELALDGLADDLHVVRLQSYRWYEHAGTQYVGGELIIKVLGS
jgi:hypothetical protein